MITKFYPRQWVLTKPEPRSTGGMTLGWFLPALTWLLVAQTSSTLSAYVINDLNVNSAIACPDHDEILLDLNSLEKSYTLRGDTLMLAVDVVLRALKFLLTMVPPGC